MAKGKYDSRIIQEGTSWRAEIVRKISSKKTGVSKAQGGFSSESEAMAWVEKELAVFLKNLGEQNKRRAVERELEVERDQERTRKTEKRNAQKLKNSKNRGSFRDQ